MFNAARLADERKRLVELQKQQQAALEQQRKVLKKIIIFE